MTQIKHLMKAFIIWFSSAISPNGKYAVGFRQANPSFLALFLKNLFSPQFLFSRAQYGQILWLPKFMRKSKEFVPVENNTQKKTLEIDACVQQLSADGFLVLDEYFLEEINDMTRHYKIGEEFCPELGYYSSDIGLQIDNDKSVCSIVTDPQMLNIFGSYYKCQPFMRFTPNVRSAKPTYDAREELDGDTLEDIVASGQHPAIRWHWDTPNQLLLYVALEDIHENGTTTMVAKGSHKNWHRIIDSTKDNDYSQKMVMNNYEVVKIAAKKGSAIIFDTNGLHRYYPVKDSHRNIMILIITTGNNILDVPVRDMPMRDGSEMPEKPDMQSLQPSQKLFISEFYEL